MAGGGDGAFIGAIHRAAARLDGEVELVCGAFSADAGRSRATGAALRLAPERSYDNWRAMLGGESRLPAGERAEFIVIVTPNVLHLPIAEAALRAGFHVLSDKPATASLAEARQLAAVVHESGRRYALTHTYLGYPLVNEARERVLAGELGTIRRVIVQYPQGWLAGPLESTGQKQAAWRTDPTQAGPGGSIADIGVHAFNLAEFVTGQTVVAVCADLASVVPGRAVDDDAAVFLRFAGGARGLLIASQVATGEGNDLSIAIYGSTAALAWSHATPNTLRLMSLDGREQYLRAGTDAAGLGATARSLCRTPVGHPEGFIEAFANLYRAFAADVRAFPAGPATLKSPAGIDAALRGMRFVDGAIRSSAAGQIWVNL
jgi:predicted dehydrogenase